MCLIVNTTANVLLFIYTVLSCLTMWQTASMLFGLWLSEKRLFHNCASCFVSDTSLWSGCEKVCGLIYLLEMNEKLLNQKGMDACAQPRPGTLLLRNVTKSSSLLHKSLNQLLWILKIYSQNTQVSKTKQLLWPSTISYMKFGTVLVEGPHICVICRLLLVKVTFGTSL